MYVLQPCTLPDWISSEVSEGSGGDRRLCPAGGCEEGLSLFRFQWDDPGHCIQRIEESNICYTHMGGET